MGVTIIESMNADRPVIGVVHLPPLPASAAFDGDRAAIRDRALSDAKALEAGGVAGIIVENYGDAPFFGDEVPKSTVAEMTVIASEIASAVDVPIGVNVLRNDADAAVSIAAAVEADFVRVNVHVGAAATDQGVLEGRAHETIRLRDRLDGTVAILADVHVKHATPIGTVGIERTAIETVDGGLADGVIVSGTETGSPTNLDDLERVSNAVAGLERSVPVFVGSGVTTETVATYFDAGADAVIVGTAVKHGGSTTSPVDEERVERLVAARKSN